MAKKKQPERPTGPKPTPPRPLERVAPPIPSATIRPTATARPQAIPVRPAVAPIRPAAAEVTLPIERRPVVWWPPLVLVLVAVALYANTFGHKYALDDIAAVGQNLFVKQGLKGIPDLLRTEFWHFSNISLGYYRPLSLITFAIEQEYFKDNPGISHMINTGLYGLTGLVLGLLLQKWLPGQTITAFLIGLLFIAHPIHTEIVANIKGRDEILSFLFIVTMLLTYWRYLESGQRGWVVAACLSLYLAFLSKESSVVSLALIPAMTYFFARRSVWQSSLSVWPFLIVAALFFYQKKAMIGTLSGTPPVDWANYPYAIEKTQTSTMFKFLAYYIRLLVVPQPLVYDYSYNVIPSGGKGDLLTWTGFFSLIGLVWLMVKGIIKRTLWGFGLVWFFVTMIPGLGFILSRGGIFAERFAYAAVLGLAFIVVWVAQYFLVKPIGDLAASSVPTEVLAKTPQPQPMLVRYAPLLALMAVVAGLYSFKTVTRNPDWKDNFTLFNSALPAAATSCQVQRHVANEWIEKGLKSKTRMDTLNKKLADPKFVAQPDSVKAARIGVDTLNKATARYARWALDHLQESCRIYPSFGEAYFSMAYVFQRITPNRDSAVYYYKQTIRAANAYAPAYNNLGVIYQNEGKYPLASYYYNRSMVVNPAYADGRNNWANLKKQTGVDVSFLPDSVLTRN
ncbi:MAG: tetratricopeptide repeat protein [Bacteroidetes bacterium]|nr:tetratricopeptide repeat protein [Fibrella sp.]